MAVSYDTWRRAHGFSDADAPTSTELALRMMVDKGAVTPELTEALLRVFAPEAVNAATQGAQQNSAAPLSPEIQQALSGQPMEEAPPVPLAEPGETPVEEEVAPATETEDVTAEEIAQAEDELPPPPAI
jgi:hypothetical protein